MFWGRVSVARLERDQSAPVLCCLLELATTCGQLQARHNQQRPRACNPLQLLPGTPTREGHPELTMLEL